MSGTINRRHLASLLSPLCSSNPSSLVGPDSGYCTMSNTYAPPSGPHPQRAASLADDEMPDEPPPAYTPAAGQGDTSVQAGPSHLDLAHQPPPNQGRLEQDITGVGVGYGLRPGAGSHTQSGTWGGGPMSLQVTGVGMGGPPPPPTHPSRTDGVSHHAGPSRPGRGSGLTPTETPTSGRPLLSHGQMLVFPRGYFCQKCGWSPFFLSSLALP